MTHVLSILLGSIVGLSTGLSGAGGSLLAIPLLIYGLSFPPREALATSLAATGAACLVGVIPRLLKRQVELRIGLLFAAAGMVGAPPGTWFAARIPEPVLIGTLAALMFGIAFRLLRGSSRLAADAERPPLKPHLVMLLMVGLTTGFLSGTFGVGGGFMIVPALVLLGGMPIHRAVATTLFVMSVISSTGAIAYFIEGQGLVAPGKSLLFVTGAAAGVLTGGMIATRLSEFTLRRVFAAIILLAALLLTAKTIASLSAGPIRPTAGVINRPELANRASDSPS